MADEVQPPSGTGRVDQNRQRLGLVPTTPRTSGSLRGGDGPGIARSPRIGASATERVAAAARRFTVGVEGTFQRHAAPNRAAFEGGTDGRWGANFRVIYLGRPLDGVIIEAYRHLVEDAQVPAERVRPRTLYEVAVAVPNVLDLRPTEARLAVGLTEDEVHSPVGDYARCQAVGAAAHQLNMRGILVNAAHERGETLALFRNRLALNELPRVERTSTWVSLPPDPRTLRAIKVAQPPR